MSNHKTFHVKVRKADGRIVEGLMKDDGLQDLWWVVTATGSVCVSVLDQFLTKEEL